MTRKKRTPAKTNFGSTLRTDVPQGRKGKHSELIGKISSDLDSLPADRALKIPLSELKGGKVHVRAAISRAAVKRNRPISTASDGEYLYVWQPDGRPDDEPDAKPDDEPDAKPREEPGGMNSLRAGRRRW